MKHLEAAERLNATKEFDAALKEVNTAIEIDPKFGRAYFERAGIVSAMSDVKDTAASMQVFQDLLKAGQLDSRYQLKPGCAVDGKVIKYDAKENGAR